MRNKMAAVSPSISEREKRHKEISTEIAEEGIVLLENKGILPLEKTVKRVALFGSGARRTVKGGTGSGDVNTRDYVTVEQGLKNAGLQIVSDSWLNEQEHLVLNAQKEYDDQIRELSHKGVNIALLTMMGKPFKEPEMRGLNQGDLSEADAAIYVLARNSGEGADRKNIPGDYMLTENEKQDITLLARTYECFILLLNVGGVVDIGCIRELPGAVVLMSQGGSGGGDAVAKVLTGEVNPSGKLTATWAKRYEDYPFADEFALTPDDVWYKEGIFVGYRWFDSFHIEPLYSFGYGLSYTTFEVETKEVSLDKSIVSVKAAVTNTGKYIGKEVVQVYVSQPEGELTKAEKILAGFQKTKNLAPGETEIITIQFSVQQMASYDSFISAWVLEKGVYRIQVGTDSAKVRVAASMLLDVDVVTERCKKLFRSEAVNEIKPVRRQFQTYVGNIIKLDPDDIIPVNHNYTGHHQELNTRNEKVSFEDVCLGKATAEDMVGCMTAKEQILLCIGAARISFDDFSVIGNASKSIPGAAGDTTDRLTAYGIPQCAMADGPAGIRVNPKIWERADGYINNVAEDPIMGKILPPEMQRADLSGTTLKYQYCTALPVAVQLAQTWNPMLVEKAGDLVGEEMEELGIDLWLAPGMNIQRNPLCGRNFEYYSEDPLLSGVFAAAMTKGVQKHPGKGTCIKHLAVNNQETNRATSNSHVCEHTLREIYLKGYEICIKESQPLSAMTSMNLLNGIHTANDKDLLTYVLRDEWGFDGIVMTDWGVTGGYVSTGEKRCYGPAAAIDCITAGNDLIMPGTQRDEDSLVQAVEKGDLSLADLQTCAVRLVKLLVKCAPGMEGKEV